MYHIIILALSLVVSGKVQAQSLTFDNISQEELESILDEFSANFHHTSVSGASTLGRLFGFELGLVAGATKTPKIEKIVKQQDPSAKAEALPHAHLLGVLTVPLGITAEIGIVPKVGDEDFKFSRMSAAVKWTATETLLSDLPVSLALKAHYTKVDLDMDQTLNNQPVTVGFEDSVFGLNFLVSKNLAIVEPYLGLGYLSADGEMSVTGNTSIFNFTSATSASSKESSFQYLLGAEVKLVFLKLGLEYSRQFETDRYSAKLAVYF